MDSLAKTVAEKRNKKHRENGFPEIDYSPIFKEINALVEGKSFIETSTIDQMEKIITDHENKARLAS